MNLRPLAFALPLLSFLAPALVGCHFETFVGADDGGIVVKDSGTVAKDAGCPGTEVCNMPMIPTGCSITPGSCVDGQYVCPEVVCPDSGTTVLDAGSCTPAPCAEPNIPAGCSMGNASCDNGQYVCPPVICPDSGTTVIDAGSCTPTPCAKPSIPAGCSMGSASCNNGQYVCPPVICPDSGAAGTLCAAAGGTCTGTGAATCAQQAPDSAQDCNPDRNPGGSFCCLDTVTTVDAGACVTVDLSGYDVACTRASDCTVINAGQICDGTCPCGNATINSKDESKYEQAVSGITFGHCGCPAMAPPQCVSGKCVFSSALDEFACGTSGVMCDSATQYCEIIQGGAMLPDGGVSVNASCNSYPTGCGNDLSSPSATCACLKQSVTGQCTYDSSGSQFTVTVDVP